MKFTAATLTSVLLLASTVAATPSADRRHAVNQRRMARRAQHHHDDNVQLRKGKTSLPGNRRLKHTDDAIKTTVGAVYSGATSNWAGAEVNGDGVSAVSGTVTVPSASVPAGGSSGTNYAGAAWVGIDGGDGCDVIIQTGVDWSTGNGFSAWYEWYPAPSYTFNIDINEGDVINMKVVASSSTSGTLSIINQSTGQSAQQFLSGQGELCEAQGEWIVEDYSVSGGYVPFADFSDVSFTNCQMTDSAGTVGLSGAGLVTMAQNGQTLASCSVSGSSTLNCQYGS